MLNSKSEANRACSHLSSGDNELIFALVDEKSFSLCTVIAEIYQTNGPTHRNWNKISIGALCFEKDYSKKSYYFRLYCLLQQKMVWEQEIYRHMDITITRSFLLTFEGEVIFNLPQFVQHFTREFFISAWNDCDELCLRRWSRKVLWDRNEDRE